MMQSRRLVLKEVTREELHESKDQARHELPKAVQKMSRADTVCRFCGVSYLIFNEFKDLESKLQVTQEELQEAKRTNNLDERIEQALTEQASKFDLERKQLQAKFNKQESNFVKDIQQRDDLAHRKQLVLQQQIARLARSLGSIRTEHESLRSFVKKSIRTERSTLQDAFRNVIDRAGSIEHGISKHQNEALSHEQKAVELHSEILKQTQEVNEFKREIKRLQEDLQAAQTNAASSISDLTSKTEADISNLQKEHRKEVESLVKKHMHMLEKERAENITRVQDLKANWSSERLRIEAEAHANLSQLRNDLEKRFREERIKQFESHSLEIEQGKLTMRTVQERLKGIESEREHLQCDLETLKTKYAHMQEKFTQAEKARLDVLTDLQQAQGSANEASSQCAKFEAELRITIDHHTSEVQRLEAEISKLQDCAGALRSKEEATAIELANIRQQSAQQSLRLEETLDKLQDANERIKQMQSLVQSIETQNAIEQSSVVRELEKQLQKAQDNATQTSVQALKEKRQVEAELISLRAEVEDTKQVIAKANQKIDILEASLQAKNASLQQVEALCKELQSETTNLRLIRAQCENYKQQLAELQGVRNHCKDLEKQLADVNNTIQNTAKQQNTTSSDEVIGPSFEDLEALEQHMIRLSGLVRQKDAEIKVLQATVHRQCLERTSILSSNQRT